MARHLDDLTAAERYTIGLNTIVHTGSLTALTRETGLDVDDLQQLREEFLAAARRGLADAGGSGLGPAADVPVALRAEVAPRLFEVAAALAEVGRPAAADRAFRRLLELDGGNGLYRKGYALFLFQSGRLAEARRWAAESLVLMPGDAECDVIVATALLAAEDEAQARQHLERACAQPALPDHLLGPLAELLVATGGIERAMVLVEREVYRRRDADDREALHLLAELQVRTGRFADAAAVLSEGLERWGPQPRFQVLLGRLEWQHLRKPEEGIARLASVVAAYPRFVGAQLALGDAYQGVGRWADAEQQAMRVLWTDPRNSDALAALLAIYRATGRVARLRVLAADLLREDPRNHALRLHLMQALMDEGDFVALGAEIEAVRAQAPDSVELQCISLYMSFESGEGDRVEAAEAALVRLLEGRARLGDRLDLLLTLCRYLRLHGEAPRALRLLAVLPRADRDGPPVLVERAMALVEAGDRDAARAVLEEVWRREPFLALHGARLAHHLFVHHGDRVGALRVLHDARRLASWNDGVALGLATATATVGEPGEALGLIYEYFVAAGRFVPAMSYLHDVIGDPAAIAGLTREQQVAAHAVHVAGAATPTQVEPHLNRLRELAATDAERAVVAGIEALLAPAGP